MIFFFFLVNGNGEERKKEGREKLHSLKGDEDKYMATELPKNLKTSLKALSKKALHTTQTYGKIVCRSVFF